MKKTISLLAKLTIMLIIFFSNPTVYAQTCKSGILNPEVSEFLKGMPVDNRSLEELKSSTNFVEYRKIGPPPIPFPARSFS